MRYEMVLAPEAVVDLNRLTTKRRREVKSGIEKYLRHEPRKVSKSRIKRLAGLSRPQFRLRLDEVPVFYDVVEDSVEVLAIVEKSQAAEWLKSHGDK